MFNFYYGQKDQLNSSRRLRYFEVSYFLLEAENTIIKPRLRSRACTQTWKSALKKGRVGARGSTPRVQRDCGPGFVRAVPVQFTGTKLDAGYFRTAARSSLLMTNQIATENERERIRRAPVT